MFAWESGRQRTIRLAKDIQSLAAKRWVHLAVVVKRATGTVQWFVDGSPELPQVVSGMNALTQGSQLHVGDYSDSYWSLDEFRVSLRAASAAEIKQWATTVEPAASAPFGQGCYPLGRNTLLDGTAGGRPTIGNAGHKLTVYGLPGSTVVLGLGSNPFWFRGQRLPLDLRFVHPSLAGCTLHTSAELFAFGKVSAVGRADFALPIPNVTSLTSAKLYSQALLDSAVLKRLMSTNSLVTVVGR